MLNGYDTTEVCRIIQVSRSSYYRAEKTIDNEEKATENAVINCFEEHKGNYGRIRIKKALSSKGINISEAKIARIMRENGLIAKVGRKRTRRAPKISDEQYIEENLIKDKFSIKEANYLWCSDISELKCKSGKIYVCGIIDVATRRMVGMTVDKSQTQRLVQEAFLMAVGRNPNRPKNAVYHSDRGCQYTAKKTKELVEKHGFRKSMSRPGTPNDNQPIESFWRTLECELPDISHLSFEDAKRVIFEYVELYYNSTRLHSGIGYSIPNQFFTVLSVHNS